MRKVRVLIAGRSQDAIRSVEALLDGFPKCRTESRLMSNGHSDPLQGVANPPDLLLLHHVTGQLELEALIRTPAPARPTVVVFGDGTDAAGMRMAMRAGARDFLPIPVSCEELREIVAAVAEEIAAEKAAEDGDLLVFINGKGGSGSSFLAANVAHGLASNDRKVTLVDMDLQFAGLRHYLDLAPKRCMIEAIEALDSLDEVAAEAYTCEHASGLRLLAAQRAELVLNSNVAPDRLVALLQLYRSINDFVIVALPRTIDVFTASVLENADRIMVLTQQSVPHLHDTARLLELMRQEIGVSSGSIQVVVNRYDKRADITVADVKKALKTEDLLTIPNQFKVTAESINSGMPLTEVRRSAAVAKGLQGLSQSISGADASNQGLLNKVVPGLVAHRFLGS